MHCQVSNVPMFMPRTPPHTSPTLPLCHHPTRVKLYPNQKLYPSMETKCHLVVVTKFICPTHLL